MIIQNGDVTVNGEVCTMRGKKCVKATLQSLTEKKLPLSELGMIFLKVLALKFENYRNLDDAIITPCDGVNVIYGDNAQGKTNLLEAFWMFCGGHSFRGSKDNELIGLASLLQNSKSDFRTGQGADRLYKIQRQ